MDNNYYKNSIFKAELSLQFRDKDSSSTTTDIVTHCLTVDCKSCLGSYRNEVLGHCFICKCKYHEVQKE